MAYTETDRAWIRRYMGTGAIFLQAVPLIESAVSATQSIAENGSRPDSSEENHIKGIVYGFAAVVGVDGVPQGGAVQNVAFSTPAIRGLITIEASIAQQDIFLGTLEAVGEAKLDAFREMIRLRSEGKRLAYSLAHKLGMKRPISNVFASNSREAPTATMADIFPDSRFW